MTTPEAQPLAGEIVSFGDLQEGDIIAGPHGPVQVRRAYETHMPEEMFRITVEDGTTQDVSGNHLWYVETDVDRSLYRLRLRRGLRLYGGKRWGRDNGMTEQVRQDLEYLAHAPQHKEISLADFMVIAGAESEEQQQTVVRLAQAVGPVSEDVYQGRDLLSDELGPAYAIRLYDARRLAQQLLALTTKRYRQQWPVIVGRVVQTKELVSMHPLGLHIPSSQPR